MEKFPMCRICLAKNVSMYALVNKNLHELYEKLTDIPFVTKDRRPILVCFFCCTKLKQCFWLMRKCLDAEALFSRMMNEDNEPLDSHDHLAYFNRLIKTPIKLISIVERPETECTGIKEEFPAVCVDIIVPKEEIQSDDERENVNSSCLGVEYILPHHSESQSEGDVPVGWFNIEVEELKECKKKIKATETSISEVSEDITQRNAQNCKRYRLRKKLLAQQLQSKNEVIHTPSTSSLQMTFEPQLITTDLESEIVYNSCLDGVNIPSAQSESDSEGDVPLMRLKTEVEEELEVFKKTRRVEDTSSASVAKNPKLGARSKKLEDTIAAALKRKEQAKLKDFQTTHNLTGESGTYQKESYNCDVQSSNPVTELKQHTRIPSRRKSYNCDVCQRSFGQLSNLTSHLRIHTGEKPYKCDICERSFSLKDTLTKHRRLHTGEKPHMCEVCQITFNQRSALKKHNRIHTSEKPNKCDVCQSSFNHKSYLTKHMRIHTNGKPYKCEICQHRFTHVSGLIKHSKSHVVKSPITVMDVSEVTIKQE